MCWYDIVHDFAAPVATICAAIAAVIVTWLLGKRQADIADRQAQTALNRLRLDLFERRYAIYKVAMDVTEQTCMGVLEGTLDERAERAKFRILEEATFFFPKDTCQFLNDLQQECDLLIGKYIIHKYRVDGGNNPLPLSNEVRDAVDKLTPRLSEIPVRLHRDLDFSHVTRM